MIKYIFLYLPFVILIGCNSVEKDKFLIEDFSTANRLTNGTNGYYNYTDTSICYLLTGFDNSHYQHHVLDSIASFHLCKVENYSMSWVSFYQKTAKTNNQYINEVYPKHPFFEDAIIHYRRAKGNSYYWKEVEPKWNNNYQKSEKVICK